MCIQKIGFSSVLFNSLFISFKCKVVNFYNINAFFFLLQKSLALNALPCMCLSKSIIIFLYQKKKSIIFQSYNLFSEFDHYLRNQSCSSAHNRVLAQAVLLVSVPVINIEIKTCSFFNDSWTSYQMFKNESLD